MAAAPTSGPAALEGRIAALERRFGGRLGVVILDSGNGTRIAHRADERFALCSTFKWLAAAAVLARADAGLDRLDRRIVFGRRDLLEYAPVTTAHVRDGSMTLHDLCSAAIRVSDNTAANLVLHTLGGPAGLTRYLRSLGDKVTRLDRHEPQLNDAAPGDARDTTSPAAMAYLIDRILLRDALSRESRAQLESWMRASTTGTRRLRAGLPPGWTVGDKTGTCAHNATNDVAIVRPPNRAPLLIAAYFAQSPAAADARDAALAQVGAIAAQIP